MVHNARMTALSAETRGVQWVFFDVGGTLLEVRSSVGEIYADAAFDHGYSVEAARLDLKFREAWGRSLSRSAARQHVCSDKILRQEWSHIVHDTFRNEIPEPEIRAIFEDLYERFVSAAAWRVVPGARSTLEALRNRGLALGVLSNWDLRLRDTLGQLDLDAFFDVQIISHEIGHEKPHPLIFDAARKLASVETSSILHIGDSFEADIRPARKLGFRTLWMGGEDGLAGPAADGFESLGVEFWGALLEG